MSEIAFCRSVEITANRFALPLAEMKALADHRCPKSRVCIITNDDISGQSIMVAKGDPANVEFETRAKNLLKGELKRRGGGDIWAIGREAGEDWRRGERAQSQQQD